MTKRNRSICLVLLILAVGAFYIPGRAAAEIRVGQKLPSFSGRNLNGDTVAVDKLYKDSVLVLAFWSVYCKPCVAEISSLIKLQERYKGKVTVVGINTDGELPPARIRTFIERYEKFENKKVNYEIIFDENNKISKFLGIGYLPTVLAVDASGKVIDTFVGFDEKDEAEILAGVQKMLPVAESKSLLEEQNFIFEAEVSVPACGFYDETGWRESFYGNKDLTKELDQVATVARKAALKAALKKALEKLDVMLFERETGKDCLQTFGVFLQEDPWKKRDCLTNLLTALGVTTSKYIEVVETNETWLGSSYYVRQKVSVNMTRLQEDLERINFSVKPVTINFAVINMKKVDRMKFTECILDQSKFVGTTDFPAFTIYSTQETFIRELEKMDFCGSRVFISDAGSGVIEAEIWR